MFNLSLNSCGQSQFIYTPKEDSRFKTSIWRAGGEKTETLFLKDVLHVLNTSNKTHNKSHLQLSNICHSSILMLTSVHENRTGKANVWNCNKLYSLIPQSGCHLFLTDITFTNTVETRDI